MADQHRLERTAGCAAPEVNRLLTAYGFGRATAQERSLVEAHLPHCTVCRGEFEKLNAAITVLETDRTLLETITAKEVAGAFGVSAGLTNAFGGQQWFVFVAGALYGLLLVAAMFLEIAWRFDLYGRQAMIVAVPVFVWGLLSALGGLWAEWKMVVTRRGGLIAGAMIYVVSAVLLFAGLSFFLPDLPLVEANFQTYTVQGAFLKSLVWIVPLALLFLVTPFHFVMALQRELQAGRHADVLNLLAGEKLSVAPRGTIYVRLWVLAVVLIAAVLAVVPGASRVFDNLRPAPYLNLFTACYFLRWGLYFLLGLICWFWYQRMLNEIKRECLIVERAKGTIHQHQAE